MFTCLRLFIVSLLLQGALSAAPLPWAQLKVGMSAQEIVSLLGAPVMRIKGRGFETWTYEQGAEVLMYGMVVGWTTPSSDSTMVRSKDVWGDNPRGDYYGTLRTVTAALRRPASKKPAAAAVKPSSEARQDYSGMGYEEYLQTYGRTKG